MSLTPNYSFIIPTGTDAVNLLTQCYPNFTSLDSILKPIQESGVTVATDTKVGTVHQLVRTDSSCNMFRFIATGNYVSGDTFTVDGTAVTATAMDGTSIPDGAFVINQSVVCVLNNLVLTVLIPGKTTSLSASAITYDNTGSGLVATNAQDAIDELVDSSNITYDNSGTDLTATNVQSAITELVGVAEHGLYEIWSNANPTSDFAEQSISINDFDSSIYDAIEIEWAYYKNEYMGVSPLRYEKSALVGGTLSTEKSYTNLGGGGKIEKTLRGFTITLAGTTLTIAFHNCNLLTLNTYGAAAASTQNNAYEIPVRILGLRHNS